MAGERASIAPQGGRRRIVGGGAPPLWFGMPFLLGGLLVLGIGMVNLRDEMRLADEGVEIAAAITDRVFRPASGDSSASYTISYEFLDSATGQRFAGSSSVSQGSFEALASRDVVLVTYLPSNPSTNRIGAAELQPFIPLLLGGIGALFAGAGLVVLRISWKAREKRRSGIVEAVPTASGLAGPRVDGLPMSALGRVDRFTRSRLRVIGELVLAPVGGIGFLGLAIYLAGQVGTDPQLILFAGLAGFFGVLLLSGVPALFRRGFGRTMLEVGPDGIRHRDVGRLGWSEIREVRLEQTTGSGGSDVPLATYHRVGIVPVDPARTASVPGGLARGLVGAFVRFANDQARRRGARRTMTDPSDMAPLGVYAYELEQPIAEIVASFRRYVPVGAAIPPPIEDRIRALAPAATTSEPPAPATDLRAMDAALAVGQPTLTAGQPALAGAGAAVSSGSLADLVEPTGSVAAPAADTPTLVAAQPGTVAMSRVDVFRRRGFTAGDAVSVVMPGESTTLPPAAGVIGRAAFGVAFMILPLLVVVPTLLGGNNSLGNTLMLIVVAMVFAAVGFLTARGTRERWRLATGDADLLTVGPAGLRLRDRHLAWPAIASVVSRSGRLEIRQSGTAPDEPPIALEFDLFEADDDEILDSIARYRVVDEA